MWALNRILKDKLKKPVENTEYTDVFLDFLDGEDGEGSSWGKCSWTDGFTCLFVDSENLRFCGTEHHTLRDCIFFLKIHYFTWLIWFFYTLFYLGDLFCF